MYRYYDHDFSFGLRLWSYWLLELCRNHRVQLCRVTYEVKLLGLDGSTHDLIVLFVKQSHGFLSLIEMTYALSHVRMLRDVRMYSC